MKKPENATKSKKVEDLVINSYKVTRAICCKNGNVLFDIEINGIKIYGCSVVEGKNGDFISFPQRQGKDGKWYSIVWAKLSDKDAADIIAEVEKEINA